MKHKQANPASPTAEVIWYQPTHFRQAGTLDGIDVFSLDSPKAVPIVHPQAGQVIEGTCMASRTEHDNQNYMVIDTGEREVAARTDVRYSTAFPNPVQVRLKAVVTEPENQLPSLAWEVYSRLPVGPGLWLPGSGQHLELRTRPADEWIREIESRLAPGFQTQLRQDRAEWDQLVAERTRINPIAPLTLDSNRALILAKAMTFGPDYMEAYPKVHQPDCVPDAQEFLQASARLKSFEELARIPETKEHLQSTVAAMLQEDERLRRAIAECQANFGSVESSLEDVRDMVKRLRPLGKTSVTMEQSTIREYRQRQLPEVVAVEAPRARVKRGPKMRM